MFDAHQKIAQTFNLLFLHTTLNRVMWKLSLFGVVLLLFAIFISVKGLIFLAIPFIAMAPLILFLSFHRQLFWVAGNRQLNLLPGIHTQLLVCFILVVILVACCLVLFEYFAGKGGSVHIGTAISLSIVFNCAALCVAYFSPSVLPIFWGMVILKSGAIWQVALHEAEWLTAIAAASTIVLSLHWKRWMSVSLRRKTSLVLASDSVCWRTFFQRCIALLSVYHWRPHSLLGSLLLGRADNPWRGTLGLTVFFLLLLFVSVAINRNTATWFHEDVLHHGVTLAAAVWMIGSPQFMIGRVYDNLARLWLVAPGGRNSLLLYLEGRFLCKSAINFLIVFAVVVVVAILLAPRLLFDLTYWVKGLSLLIGLALLQCLYFYLSLWIYLRSEADRKWQSTVTSILSLLLIFAASFVAGKVESNGWNFSLVIVSTLTILLACVGILRVRLANVWPRISLIRRGY